MRQNYLNLYTAAQTRELDRLAIEEAGMPGYNLMKKAGASAFHFIMSVWPNTKSFTIVCGTGNNGGDGYVIAKLAKIRGMNVSVIQLGDVSKCSGDSLTARRDLELEGIRVERFDNQDFSTADVIVDSMLGTGLQRDVDGDWRVAIESINESPANIASIDIPSGLNADTGLIQGVAINADISITFIGRKQGMYTADGCSKSGSIKFDSLSIPQEVHDKVEPSAYLLEKLAPEIIKPREKNSHKGIYGNIVMIGGAPGMNGAILLSATAALRAGCGLVTVLTHPQHASFLNLTQPEIMCRGIGSAVELEKYVSSADLIVIGPGLGTDEWGKDLLNAAINTHKSLVIDADALKNLDGFKSEKNNWVLTPHPGEAAQLLACSVSEIQQNRFLAAKKISEKYNAVCILKGAGTIIHNNGSTYVCPFGNPGMATAGMGDVLSGILGTLLAQNSSLIDAANNAVMLHALAGDRVALEDGEKGLVASDLFPAIRSLINGR